MAEELNLHFSSVFTREDTSSLHVLTLLTLLAFSLSSTGRPCPSSPLLPVYGHILGNTCGDILCGGIRY